MASRVLRTGSQSQFLASPWRAAKSARAISRSTIEKEQGLHTMTMTKRTIRWRITLVVIAAFVSSASVLAQSQTMAAGAGAGVFPEGASFNGVSLSTLSFGMGGMILTNDGTATGTFETTLVGTSLLGRTSIVI